MAEGFYTTVVRRQCGSQRVGYLLGPYDDEETARAKISIARRLAEQVDPFTAFDAFGTCKITIDRGELLRGVLMGMLENVAAN